MAENKNTEIYFSKFLLKSRRVEVAFIVFKTTIFTFCGTERDLRQKEPFTSLESWSWGAVWCVGWRVWVVHLQISWLNIENPF